MSGKPTTSLHASGSVQSVSSYQVLLLKLTMLVSNLIACSRGKYQVLAERLAVRVGRYDEENDKLLYLRSIAHMTAG